jgi:hypothetical protein
MSVSFSVVTAGFPYWLRGIGVDCCFSANTIWQVRLSPDQDPANDPDGIGRGFYHPESREQAAVPAGTDKGEITFSRASRPRTHAVEAVHVSAKQLLDIVTPFCVGTCSIIGAPSPAQACSVVKRICVR